MERPRVLSLPERLEHDADLTGRGVCAAFVDVGFYAHPDLLRPQRRIRAFVDVTRETPVADELHTAAPASWHGTMSVCVAAGSGWASSGRYRGLAPAMDVVLIKAGVDGHVRGDHVRAALEVPLKYPELGIRLINVSLGVSSADRAAASIEPMVSRLVAAGITVFAAAGNDPGAPPEAPGSARDAITVGGLDDANTPTPLDDTTWPSSHGRGKPDLLALATNLPAPMLPGTLTAREATPIWQLSSILEEAACEQEFALERGQRVHPEDRRTLLALTAALSERIAYQKYVATDYQHVDGTSFAAPITLSVAAQMLEVAPTLTPAQLRRGLVETARPLPGVPVELQGAGALWPRGATDWARKHRG
jgi:serine protease AprX